MSGMDTDELQTAADALDELLDDDPNRDPGLLYDDGTYEWVKR